MTEHERLLVQELRKEVQVGFRDIQESIIALTATQAAHNAVHAERDRVEAARVEDGRDRAVTRRWVVQVVVAACGVLLSAIGVTFAAMRMMLGA